MFDAKRIGAVVTAAACVAMVVSALWAWQNAPRVVADAARPDVAAWAVRSGAVAVAGMAQVVGLTFVVGAVYRRDLFGDVLRGAAAAVSGVAIVSAVALGLAGA
jgi:hypothetical protein